MRPSRSARRRCCFPSASACGPTSPLGADGASCCCGSTATAPWDDSQGVLRPTWTPAVPRGTQITAGGPRGCWRSDLAEPSVAAFDDPDLLATGRYVPRGTANRRLIGDTDGLAHALPRASAITRSAITRGAYQRLIAESAATSRSGVVRPGGSRAGHQCRPDHRLDCGEGHQTTAPAHPGLTGSTVRRLVTFRVDGSAVESSSDMTSRFSMAQTCDVSLSLCRRGSGGRTGALAKT